MFPRLLDRIRPQARTAGFAGLVVLSLTLPFELEAPLLSLGPLVFTNVELVLVLVLILTALAGPLPENPRLPRVWILLFTGFLIGMVIAVWQAPEFQANAAKATLRTVQGVLLIPAVLWLAPTKRHGTIIVLALLSGGLAAASIGLAEHLAGYDFPWLNIFRREATYAGPFLRLSGPIDYANQAAMYFEATLPFLFALTCSAFHTKKWVWAALGLAALLVYAQALILTFSRAGFVSLISACVFVAALLYWRPDGRRLAWLWAGLAVGIMGLVVVNWAASPYFRLRLQSNVDTEWYRSEIIIPAEFSLVAGEIRNTEVRITNRGSLTWQATGSKPFFLGARWQTEDGRSELADGPLWPLPRTIPPGESLTLDVPLQAPETSGSYRLIWDMLHQDVNWFDARGDEQTVTLVTVSKDNTKPEGDFDKQSQEDMTDPILFDAPLPGRRVLWAIAGQLIRDHPLTGIGLDNFRLTYSRYVTNDPMPGTPLDQTVHSNNWYLETLVSVGLIGTLPFSLWIVHLIFSIIKSLRKRHLTPLQIAAGAGIIIFIIHGLLDYFLLFNATALLFWIMTALWLVFNYDNTRI